MEGRWGRRIFGTVHRGERITRFYLEMKTREGETITSIIRASNEDLDQFPGNYGFILDKMVGNIDHAINHTQGDHP